MLLLILNADARICKILSPLLHFGSVLTQLLLCAAVGVISSSCPAVSTSAHHAVAVLALGDRAEGPWYYEPFAATTTADGETVSSRYGRVSPATQQPLSALTENCIEDE